MPASLQIVAQAISNIRASHAPEVISIITAHYFATTLMDRFGRGQKTSLESSIHMIDQMVIEYANKRGHKIEKLLEVNQALVSAGRQANLT